MKSRDGSLNRQTLINNGVKPKIYKPFEPAQLHRASSNFDNLSTNQSSHYSAHPSEKFNTALRPRKGALPLEIPAIDHSKAKKKLTTIMKTEGFEPDMMKSLPNFRSNQFRSPSIDGGAQTCGPFPVVNTA